MRAVDAFDAIQTSGRMEAEQLDAIVSAASSKRTPLCENASNLLDALSEKWPQVRDAILRMSRDKRAHVRFSAILCLGNKHRLHSSIQYWEKDLSTKARRFGPSGRLDRASRQKNFSTCSGRRDGRGNI